MDKQHSIKNVRHLNEFGLAMTAASSEERLDLLKVYLNSIKMKQNYSWIIPQAQAALVEQFPVALGSDGTVSISKTFSGVSGSTLGLMWILKEGPGNIVSPAWRHPQYSVFVPLILAAYRKYADVPYSKWSLENIKYVVSEPQLRFLTAEIPEFTKEELVEARSTCLKDRFNSLKTCYSPYVSGDRWDGVDPYVKVTLLQVWLAHPNVRHPDMYLDVKNPDKLPDTLMEDTVLKPDAAVTDFLKLIGTVEEKSTSKSRAKKVIEAVGVKDSDIPPWEA